MVALTAVATALIACGADEPTATWQRVPAPTVADQTDDVTAAAGTLDNGTYWATVGLVSGTRDVVFQVRKARFGAFCHAWAAEQGRPEGCLNDYDVEPFPTAFVALDDDAAVTVAQPEGPGTNRSITPATLRALLAGDATTAPDDYTWTPFPFLVVVDDGAVLDAQQFWVP